MTPKTVKIMPKKKIKKDKVDDTLKWEDGEPAGEKGDEAVPGEGVVAPSKPKEDWHLAYGR